MHGGRSSRSESGSPSCGLFEVKVAPLDPSRALNLRKNYITSNLPLFDRVCSLLLRRISYYAIIYIFFNGTYISPNVSVTFDSRAFEVIIVIGNFSNATGPKQGACCGRA